MFSEEQRVGACKKAQAEVARALAAAERARPVAHQADRLLAAAKANIFDLLDDSKLAAILALANDSGGNP
jgi:hypothetical protein